MVINHTQMAAPPKRIGHTQDGDDVVEVTTKGGLVMVATMTKGQKMTVLSCGPHRAIARYVAKQKHGDKILISELSKSDTGIIKTFGDIREYLALTDRLNAI